jgi:hypothetical protein
MMNDWIYQPGAKADSNLRNQSDDSLTLSNTRTGSQKKRGHSTFSEKQNVPFSFHVPAFSSARLPVFVYCENIQK